MSGQQPKRTAPGPASPLPSRYDDVLDQRLAQAREMLRQAQAAERRPFRWKRWVAATGVAGMLAVWILADRDEPAKGSLPFDRAAVVSADTLGLGVHAGEFLTATPRPAATPAPSPTPSPAPTPIPSHSPRARVAAAPRPPRPAPAPVTRERRLPVVEGAEEELSLDTLGVYVAALEEAGRALLPPGTRVAAMLTSAVTTGPVSAPVSATVVEDVHQGGQVVLPAGALLIGEAFATRNDDRVQVAIQALVCEGTSLPLRAIALGADGQVGLSGTVVRKASRAKKGLGRVLGAVASTLTLGAVGNGPAEAVAEGLLASGASGLSDLERAWAAERSDKVVRLAPGTRLVAWIQAKARLP